VISYCEHHVNDAPSSDEKKDDKRTDDITPWDTDFCKVDQATLFELILVQTKSYI
jgi:S-phase kinase-associated protein 1